MTREVIGSPVELLPCPFCSCADIRHECCIMDSTVWCSSCGAKICCRNLLKDEGLQAATKTWNTRAPLPGDWMPVYRTSLLDENGMVKR